MKQQFYILTTWEVVDRYEDLSTEQFAESLTLPEIKAIAVGDLLNVDTYSNELEWLYIVDMEIINKVIDLTKVITI